MPRVRPEVAAPYPRRRPHVYARARSVGADPDRDVIAKAEDSRLHDRVNLRFADVDARHAPPREAASDSLRHRERVRRRGFGEERRQFRIGRSNDRNEIRRQGLTGDERRRRLEIRRDVVDGWSAPPGHDRKKGESCRYGRERGGRKPDRRSRPRRGGSERHHGQQRDTARERKHDEAADRREHTCYRCSGAGKRRGNERGRDREGPCPVQCCLPPPFGP